MALSRDTRLRLNLLWMWWFAGVALFVAVWSSSFVNRWMYLVEQRQLAVAESARNFSRAFRGLRNRQRGIAEQLRREVLAGRLEQQTLDAIRRDAGPGFRVYYVNGKGRAVLAEDKMPAMPARLVDAARDREVKSSAVYAVQQRDVGAASTASDEFFAYACSSNGNYVVVDADLDAFFSAWRSRELGSLGVGVSARNDAPLVDLHSAYGLVWKVPLRLRLADDSGGRGFLLVIDNYLLLRSVACEYGAIFVGGLFVLTGFAGALRLAGQGLRRELDLAGARANFSNLVSHELRTPVASLYLCSEVLVEEVVTDPATVAHYHRTMHAEAGRLRRLLDNLLALVCPEVRPLQLHAELCQVREVVEEAIERATAAFGNGAPTVEIEANGTLPPIAADRQTVCQALANVVHNAFKYGGTPPQVSVQARANGRWVIIDVLDRGAGIPKSKRSLIFEPFVRLEDEMTAQHGGTGLGLALVRLYVEGSGGKVEAHDRPGGGTCFRLAFRSSRTSPC